MSETGVGVDVQFRCVQIAYRAHLEGVEDPMGPLNGARLDWAMIAPRLLRLHPNAGPWIDRLRGPRKESPPRPRVPNAKRRAVLRAATLWAVQFPDDSVALGALIRCVCDNGHDVSKDDALRLIRAARQGRQSA